MLAKYIIAALAAVGLAASTFAAIQTKRLNTAQLDIAVLEAQVGDKDALIDAQSKGITDLEKAEAARIVAMTEAGARIAALHTELAAERAKRRVTVEKDYALPDCLTLLATDLAGVCPAHAQRLRDAANR